MSHVYSLPSSTPCTSGPYTLPAPTLPCTKRPPFPRAALHRRCPHPNTVLHSIQAEVLTLLPALVLDATRRRCPDPPVHAPAGSLLTPQTAAARTRRAPTSVRRFVLDAARRRGRPRDLPCARSNERARARD